MQPQDPITTVIAQRVRPGRENDYEAWISGIIRESSALTGHMGTHVIRPQPGVRPEYVVIFRFDTDDHFRAWMTSEARRRWIERAEPLVASDPQVRHISGLEAWFSLPGEVLPPPSRHKMALVTWVAVYTLIRLLSQVLAPLLHPLPAWLALLITSGLTVLLLTYGVMHRLTRLLKRWLYPRAAPAAAADDSGPRRR